MDAIIFNRRSMGNKDAPISILCDPPIREGDTISPETISVLQKAVVKAGFPKGAFCLYQLCPKIPEEFANSMSKKVKFVKEYAEQVYDEIVNEHTKLIVPLGDLATRMVMSKAVAITKARGTFIFDKEVPIMPMLSPSFIFKVPDSRPMFDADVLTIKKFMDAEWQIDKISRHEKDYQWCEDLSELIAKEPKILGVDTETTGTRPFKDDFRVLTVQLCPEPGKTYVCPVDPEFWPMNPTKRRKLLAQLKHLLEDESIVKVAHNLKFDHNALKRLDITVDGWFADTQILAFGIDENMLSKDLDQCVRRWVPEMAGYNDQYNELIDKSDMLHCPKDLFLPYAGGDPDAALRLFYAQDEILSNDEAQYSAILKVQTQAVKSFTNIERFGLTVNREKLQKLTNDVTEWLDVNNKDLLARIPRAIVRRELEAGKEIKFTRDTLIRDIFFSKEGFNLKPIVFTKGTKNLKDESEKVPSVSSKDHLPFFIDREDAAGQFVRDFIEYTKTETLKTNFLNNLPSHIYPDGKIRPSYSFHRTVTGRSASNDPNGQNSPKRGPWAKPLNDVYEPTPGYRFISADLSQIELRLVAWASGDPTMLEVYRKGGDIHTTTAMVISGLSEKQFYALDKAERKLLRFKAKAANFGLIYGMMAKKFQRYAKTDYNVDYTLKEATEVRNKFFSTYNHLEPWHESVEAFVRKHGYVRAFHGAVRHLPSVFSPDEWVQLSAVRQAINSPIQRLGSDLGLIAINRLTHQLNEEYARVVAFIHDNIILEVKIGYEVEMLNTLLWVLSNPMLDVWFGLTPPLPIEGEGEIGMSLGSMLEIKELPETLPEWTKGIDFSAVKATKPTWWDDAADLALAA